MSTILKKLNLKGYKKVIVIAFIAVVAGVCSVSFISNTADISRLNAKMSECDKQYSEQIEENEKIKAILDSDNKDAYIEQKAREKGYVKDGETVFYDISASK